MSPPWDSWPSDGRKNAAVAFLFAPPEKNRDDARVILMRRTTSVGSHKGQIGFAGGRADPEDCDPIDTALRETWEELGIERKRICVHGLLPPTRSIDGSTVVPVVATTDMDPRDYAICKEEVDYLLTPSWSLLTQAFAQSFAFTMFGKRRTSHLFIIGNDRVWGLTARILHDANLERRGNGR